MCFFYVTYQFMISHENIRFGTCKNYEENIRNSQISSLQLAFFLFLEHWKNTIIEFTAEL